jgi:hypothetical protein
LGINIFWRTTRGDPEDLIYRKTEEGEERPPRSLLHSNKRIAQSVRYATVVVDLMRSQGLFATVKLTLSFLQVLMGTIPRLNIEWNHFLLKLVNVADLNPMNYFPIITGCDNMGRLSGPFVHILLIALVPMAFLVALGLVKWFMHQLLHRNAPQVLADNTAAVDKAMFDVTLKAIVWFCLFSFPLLASG